MLHLATYNSFISVKLRSSSFDEYIIHNNYERYEPILQNDYGTEKDFLAL